MEAVGRSSAVVWKNGPAAELVVTEGKGRGLYSRSCLLEVIVPGEVFSRVCC